MNECLHVSVLCVCNISILHFAIGLSKDCTKDVIFHKVRTHYKYRAKYNAKYNRITYISTMLNTIVQEG